MPEIKNTFTKGKMNLDLDERLVPKGEYKEALNVQVSTSEGSDVGSVQNILGNTALESIIGASNGYQCVGSIGDEKNNKLYWLITNDTISAIIEYGIDTDGTTPVLVDLDNSVLEFNTANQITGINIVDDFLFWTDGVTEPKKISISRSILGTGSDLSEHTLLVVKGEQVRLTHKAIWSVNFNNVYAQGNGTDILTLTGIGTAIAPIVKVGDQLIEFETSGGAIYYPVPPVSPARYVTAIDYTTGEVTVTSNIYNGSGTADIGNYVKFESPVLLNKEHITVIKKKPTQAPTMDLTTLGSEYGSSGSISAGIDFSNYSIGSTVTINVDLAGFTMVGAINVSYSAITLVTGTNVPIGTSGIIKNAKPLSVVSGDNLLLSDPLSPGVLPSNTQVKLLVTSVSYSAVTPQTYDTEFEANIVCKILSVDSDAPASDISYDFQIEDLNDLLFDRSYPRFSYRYKYEDGEYSPFGPFTDVGFAAGEFSIHPTREPYNSAMDNKVKQINLREFITHDMPLDVVEVDLLYKPDNSAVVYAIDTIKPTLADGGDNPAWSLYDKDVAGPTLPTGAAVAPTNTGFYAITTENIHAALPSNQLLRPWDNVPKKAQAQDFTANRLIYGNYTQNLKLGDYNNELTLSYEKRNFAGENIDFEHGKSSIKSQRAYQAGIVFGDRYGRETPVFSGGEGGSTKVPYDRTPGSYVFSGNASVSNRIVFNNKTTIPAYANDALGNEPYYFKVFIKETASEYYNLVMDRVYRAEEDGNLWISFPSSDRNKIQEDDYMILKKSIESDVQVKIENKFKIIDIKNEAPEFIRKKYIELVQANGSGDINTLYINGANRPAEGVGGVVISKEALMDEGISDIQKLFDNGDKLSISFRKVSSSSTQNSRRYHITSLSTDGTSPEYYNIKLDKPILPQDAWVEWGTNSTMNTIVWKEEIQEWEEFQGRFFVKIISDIVTDQYLEPQIGIDSNVYTSARTKVYYMGDGDTMLGYPANRTIPTPIENTSGVVVAATGTITNASTIGGLSHDMIDWQKHKITVDSYNPFIDSLYTASQQPTKKADTTGSANYWRNVPSASVYDVSTSGNLFKYGVSSWYGFANGNRFGGHIDGLEGIITTDSKFNNTGNGKRRWQTQPNHETNDDYVDNTYGSANGSFFMHLSFPNTGENLHTGSSAIQNLATSNEYRYHQNLIINTQHITNYNQQPINSWQETMKISGDYHPSNRDKHIGSTYGGQNQTDQTKVNNQWNPLFNNPNAANIINELHIGSRFKFDNDANGVVFRILNKPAVKHLYNHTGWNKMVRWDAATSAYVEREDTVNYHWNAYVNSTSTNQGTNLYLVNQLNSCLYRFGQRNNRRVTYVIQLDKDPTVECDFSSLADTSEEGILELDYNVGTHLSFEQSYVTENSSLISDNPAIWETEPKDTSGLDIYYEASNAIPLKLDMNSVSADYNSIPSPDNKKGYMIGPVGSAVRCNKVGSNWYTPNFKDCVVEDWDGNIVTINPGLGIDYGFSTDEAGQTSALVNSNLEFFKDDLSFISLGIHSVPTGGIINGSVKKLKLDRTINQKIGLSYFNCFSFGNGVESNRIRDDFNKPFISNGVKASTTLQEQYLEDHKSSGLIYSGLYSKNSSLNSLNQFIMAEKITKDLLPTYGSIQKLYARDLSLIHI